MARSTLAFLMFVIAFGQAGCSKSPEQPSAGQDEGGGGVFSVYVVNYPLKYFAERIGGEHVAVRFPTPADEDPAFWMPTPETIAAYQRADLILLNGANYAKWVDKVSLPESKLCDTSASFKNEYIPLEEAVTHSHGPEGEHTHGDVAFTTWLDPKLAVEHARAIRKAFSERQPEQKSDFEANLAELEKDLIGLDAAIETSLANLSDDPLVFSHPVYQYFGRRYNLNAMSVHWEPDEAPTAEQWSELDELLKKHKAKWMIWEGDPKPDVVARLREMGVESIVFRPCGNEPEDGDYLTTMNQNLQRLTEVSSVPVSSEPETKGD
jgi:zinc transport system substrate-binding protein